jgi:DNA-binding transcriptional regulator LsrR (DeoR family)
MTGSWRPSTAALGRVIGVAMAPPRLKAVRGALIGKLINGLITNEKMAELLLK